MIRRRKSKAPAAGRASSRSSPARARCWRWWAAAPTAEPVQPRHPARRQPGSTFKPFVYLAAFEATFDDPDLPPITPATVVEDAPTRLPLRATRSTRPENYEDNYMGYVTLRRALAHSLNVATVKVAEMVGYDRVADLWNKKMGMPGKVQPYPAIALGSFEATPLEMATAYNVLANRRPEGGAGHRAPGDGREAAGALRAALPRARRAWRARSRRSWSST